ncbi:hypothetical protein [Euzebya tangerina]|uniref:hypothetical protein n=1 Tax=Euzebya tangerina TaxID=591198 RepID=UPI0013C2F8A7|nr:hypothetical protein [Euzebya tangerina]
MQPIHAWDEVFIRCRRQTVNALVVDVRSWGAWWPDLGVTTLGDERFGLTIRRGVAGLATQQLLLTRDRVRPRDKGLEFSVRGDVVGTGEWYHLDHPNGVVVHYLLRGELTGGNPRRWLGHHRASVRSALTDLKRRLERGRVPGAEPHPDLLTHQAEELSIFAEEVAAHERKIAAAASGSSTEGGSP